MKNNKKYNKGINTKKEFIRSLTKMRTACDSLLRQESNIKRVLNGIEGQANFKHFQEIVKNTKKFNNELTETKEAISEFKLKDNQCIEVLQSLKNKFDHIIQFLNKPVATIEKGQILYDRIKTYVISIQEDLFELSIISSCLWFIGSNFPDLDNDNVDIDTFDWTTLKIAWIIMDYIIKESQMLEERIVKYNYGRRISNE